MTKKTKIMSFNDNSVIPPLWLHPSKPIYPANVMDNTRAELERNYRGPSCTFCRENSEPFEIWSSHQLKNPNGTVNCPILRKYRCNLCGETGDNAHTRSYCPFKNESAAQEVLGPGYFFNMVELKRGDYNSAGRPIPNRYRKDLPK